MLVFKTLLLLFAAFATFIMGLAVLQQGRKKLVNVSFAAVCFSMSGWTLGIAAFLLTNSYATAYLWAKIYYFFPLLIAVFLVLFARSFPDYSQIPKKWVYPTILGFLALGIPLLLSHRFITSEIIYHDWGKEVILNNFHYFFYAIYLLICYPLALFLMYLKSRREAGLYGRQADLFFRGFLITFIFGVGFNLILPWFGNYRLIWLGPLFTSVFVIAIAYSIVRHRMFDIRLFVARSLGYLLSFFSLGLLYGVIAFVLITVLFKTEATPIPQRAINAALAVSLAFLFQPIRNFFNRVTNSIFYRDAYDTQHFIDELNQVLVSVLELEELLKRSSEIIEANLKADFCLFGLRETDTMGQRIIGHKLRHFPEEEIAAVRSITPHFAHKVIVVDDLESDNEKLRGILAKNNIAVLARLVANAQHTQEGVGYLVLGPKRSGNPYNKQDIKNIEIIANELVIAIQNALRFEEIENFNITLQQKVTDATIQLRHTNEKLKALDEAKDEFISMASHQLRTPLTSVKGYVSMVLDGDAGKLSEQQQKLLKQAFTSSQRMVYIIADLLNVSRLKTGKFVIESKPANLADITEDETALLKDAADVKDIKLEYKKPKDFPQLMLDETKVRQVIMNFIDNALYYTPNSGHIKVTLEDKPDTVEFTVEDNGVGVPRSDQHHLFTKFYRAENARKVRPDGTGLGLFMAKKVIVAQGGAVIFKSEEGKGSTFGFTFSKQKLGSSKS